MINWMKMLARRRSELDLVHPEQSSGQAVFNGGAPCLWYAGWFVNSSTNTREPWVG